MENNKQNITISNTSPDKYFFLLNASSNLPVEYNFYIQKNSMANLFFYVFSFDNRQKYLINVHHESTARSTCSVVALSAGSGHISLTINSIIKPGSHGAKSDQQIDGIILSKTSSIEVTPGMSVGDQKTHTAHSVNIGMINPEKIFYFESRGIETAIAKKTLLESHFHSIKSAKTAEVKCLYNKVMELFNKALNN